MMYSKTVQWPLSTVGGGIHGNIDTCATPERLLHSLWGCSQPTGNREGVPVYTIIMTPGAVTTCTSGCTLCPVHALSGAADGMT